MSDLFKVLEGEANVLLKWLKENEMIANPGKFQAILIKKDRSDTSGIEISLSDKNIKLEKTAKLLGVKLDNKLNFDSHISDLCKIIYCIVLCYIYYIILYYIILYYIILYYIILYYIILYFIILYYIIL